MVVIQRHSARHRKRKRFGCLALLLFLIIGAACAFYNGLTVREYTLRSPKLKEEITVVLLSDLHSCIYGNEQQALLQIIMNQDPDLILLAGDIVDDKTPTKGAELLLQGIRDLCPIYYVTGNHEYWAESIADIREMISSYGVIILSDAYTAVTVKATTLTVAGVEDPDKRAYEDASYQQDSALQQVFASLPQQAYSILLAHRPERIASYLPYGFDLVVSGHAHGGQVRLPFILNGLYAPNQGFFPPYAGGLYIHGSTNHIVSRGVSFNPRLPRIFNPPEVVVIRLAGG